MNHLRAVVRHVTGSTRHLVGAPQRGGIEIAPVPNPATVEIVEEDGAFFLLRLDESGACLADTWHETLEGAKAQAHFEFRIAEGDWNEL